MITCLNRQTVTYLVSVGVDTVGGRYRLKFTQCRCGDTHTEGRDTTTVFSDFVNIQSSVNPWCSPAQFTGNTSLLSMDTPAVTGTTTVFHFTYSPCSSVQPYDKANVTLYSADTREDCGQVVTATSSVEIFTNTAGEAAILYVPVTPAGR